MNEKFKWRTGYVIIFKIANLIYLNYHDYT